MFPADAADSRRQALEEPDVQQGLAKPRLMAEALPRRTFREVTSTPHFPQMTPCVRHAACKHFFLPRRRHSHPVNGSEDAAA